MRFLINRASQGAVSQQPPCKGAVCGPESKAWPGEFQWFIELANLEELVRFLHDNGGGLGLFTPEEGDEHAGIEIFDEDEMEADED